MPFLLWKFGSTTSDESYHSNSSHPTEVQIAIRPQEHDEAFCLDGKRDYVEVAKARSLIISQEDFSLSAWIKTNSHELVTIVDQRDEKKEAFVKGFSLFLYNGSIGFQLADRKGSWNCENNNPKSSCSNWLIDKQIADNKWHHVAVTVDRDRKQGLAFFIDGKIISKKNPTFRNGSLETVNPLRVGSRSSSETTLFPGAIGEVKLFNYVLSKEDVAFDFKLGLKRHCH